MVYFREVQPIRQWWISLLLAVPLVFLSNGFYQQAVLGRPWGNRPMSTPAFAVLLGAFALFVVWLHLVRLVTEVRDDELVIRYAGLWPTRRITFPEIVSAQDVTYSPILDYGGWGVRWGWDGSRVYNAKGNKGVKLVFRYGKPVVVGSQRSRELAEAIHARLGQSVTGFTQNRV
jgi:hypothetical protein